jgi:nucleoside-diphosphate-sugar epimerase
LLGTQLVAQAVAAGSLAAVTARLFTVYGPGEHRGRLLPTLLDAAGGDTLIPLTTGEQRRDFTYVEDVAAGLLRLGLSSSSPYPIVNLATGKLYQVKEFVLTAARILRIPVGRLGFGVLPSRSTDMIHSAVRIRRIRQMLGWAPSTDITVGISRTAEFVQREARPALPEGGRDGV